MIGCYKARVVPVNLNYRYVAPELRYVMDNAELEMLVFERALAPWWPSAPRRPAARRPRLVVVDRRPGRRGRRSRPTAIRYEAALASSSPERGFGPRSADDIYVLYTGGTTGMPKGVLWRQEDIFFAAMGGGGWGAEPITHPDELAGRLNPDERPAWSCWWWRP